ncbi:5422_t:CDS:2, partial [Racocetra persica]
INCEEKEELRKEYKEDIKYWQLSKEIIVRIKDLEKNFKRNETSRKLDLTIEQQSLLEELIPNSEYEVNGYLKKNAEFVRQVKVYEEFHKQNNLFRKILEISPEKSPELTEEESSKFAALQTHPQAIYTSRLLAFNNLPEPQNSEEINNEFYNSSKQIDFAINFDDFIKTQTLPKINKQEVVNQLDLPHKQFSQFKILELTQFMFTREASQQDISAAISFPVLLSELTGFAGGQLGSPNHGYIKPLVRDLLQQLHQNNNPDLEKYLHYKLKADEKRFFAHLPPNFPKAELDRAKRVYAGILTANYSGIIFARSWWKTDAGKAIYFMLDLETSPKKNYFQE